MLIFGYCCSHCLWGGGGGLLFALVFLFSALRPSSFAIILMGNIDLVALLQVSSDSKCSVALPHGAACWSVVCDFVIP